MVALSTPWSRTMGLTAPILNAPMGGVAGGRLAAAVSAAGGLGMIGVGSAGSVALLERESDYPRQAGLHFGIGLLDWALAREPALLDAALAAAPTVVSVSFGDAWAWAGQVRDAGILTATQVFDVSMARRAADAGVELVVARGAEGGGHGEPAVGTLPLLEAVLEAVTLPVLAAGGISSPRGLAAVLAAGASGAWLGTSFAACPESLASDSARGVLLRASETDTVTTSVFDLALGYDWPSRFPERVVRNDFWEQWSGRDDALARDDEARTTLAAAIASEDQRIAHVDAGQGVGLIKDVRPAAEVMEWLCAGAARLLGSWGHLGAADAIEPTAPPRLSGDKW
jgi:nitronate monooxygenase